MSRPVTPLHGYILVEIGKDSALVISALMAQRDELLSRPFTFWNHNAAQEISNLINKLEAQL